MNIGIVDNIYGTPKGHSYLIKDVIVALKEDSHIIHMYRIGGHQILPEFIMPDTLRTQQTAEVPEKEFREWIAEEKIECCLFFEYNQWWPLSYDKLAVCKELGVKTVAGFLAQEKFDWSKVDHYKLYDKIVCQTAWQTKTLRKKGLYNTYHIPWGVDMEEVASVIAPTKNDNKLRFYHCAGSGGVDNRKNTKAVVDAYKMIQDENTELIMTHIGNKIFTHKEIMSFMKYSDVLVNPSRWETIGLNNMEANACGIPVITTDMPPVNEFMLNNVNSLLVKATESTSKNVTCTAYDIDVEDLANKMKLCKNKIILQTLKNNSKKVAQINFDWKHNSVAFRKLFK
jgi:glycosyltransferase involved in cell wall biosynthesis